MTVCKEISFNDNLPWDELISKSQTATFFQTREWLSPWLKHFPVESKTFGVFDGEELIGIVPFSIDNQKIDLLGVTKVVGGELVSDFGDIIIKPGREKEVWEAVLRNIKRDPATMLGMTNRENIEIELNFIREESPSFEILKELGGKAKEMDVAPYIDLPKSWEDYLVGLDRHDRHELRRKMRKLEEGVVSKGDVHDIDDFFRLMELSSDRKRNFLKPEIRAFFTDVITTFLKSKMLEMWFLKYERKRIAAILYFVFKGEVLLYNSGFDPRYSYLSPGLVLNAYAIREAIGKGMKRYDFLRGGERYKYDLGGVERKLLCVSF